jgi:acetyltransferase-like isoleucine patch superfamily enzyme
MGLFGLIPYALDVCRAHWVLRRAERAGWRIRLWGASFIRVDGKLTIGDRVRLASRPVPLEIFVGAHAELSIGDRVFINHGTSIAATERVLIGDRATIGPHCIVMDSDFHRLEPDRRDEAPPSRPVTLGNNIWLGARVIVMPGVSIGDNTVVGAGSVVTRNLPPNVVAAGVPARVVRSLPGTSPPES